MRKRLLVLVIAVLLGFSLTAIDEYTIRLLPENSTGADQEADYYGEALTYRQYGSDGALQQILTADRSRHQPDRGQTLFELPAIESPPASNAQWKVTSISGQVGDGASQVLMSGDVLIQTRDDTDSALRVATESLTFFPHEGVARTDERVELRSSTSVTTSNGLQLDLDQQSLQLMSKVRTTYE